MKPLLAVENLVVDYHVHGRHVFRAVDDVCFSVDKGRRSPSSANPAAASPPSPSHSSAWSRRPSGRIMLDGTDIAALSERQLRPLRHRSRWSSRTRTAPWTRT